MDRKLIYPDGFHVLLILSKEHISPEALKNIFTFFQFINNIIYIIYNKYHSFSIRQDVIPWFLQYRFKVFRKFSIFVSPEPTVVPQISLAVAFGIGIFDLTLMIPVKRTSLSWNQYIGVKIFWKFGDRLIEFWRNIFVCPMRFGYFQTSRIRW